MGDAAGTVGVVLGAADEEAGGAEVVGLEVFGAECDQFAAAAEGVEADGDEGAVAEACEVGVAGGEQLIAQVGSNAEGLVWALRLQAAGATDGEVDFDVVRRIAHAQEVVDLADACEFSFERRGLSRAVSAAR